MKNGMLQLDITLNVTDAGTPRPMPQQQQQQVQQAPQQQTFLPPAAPPPPQAARQMFSQLSPRQADPYAQPPGTPRPVDPYAQPPGTPRPSTDDSGNYHMPGQQPPEVNRQLRDLLQRQQFKKLEQVIYFNPTTIYWLALWYSG
jgi:hypothetical protein